MAEQTTRIDRIYFLIHPCCWSMADNPDPDYLKTYGVHPSEWFAARNLERETNRKQKELIQSMGPNEALIIYPIGQSEPMLDLIATGESALGPRCIVQQAPCCEAPAQLRDMVWPTDGSPLSVKDGLMRVPVMTGLRKYASCDCCYLLGASYSYDEFRALLLSAEITSDHEGPAQ